MAGDTEYKREWAKEHLDRINLTVPKGQKAAIKAHADAHGESITAFIQRAINETMERDHMLDVEKNEVVFAGERETTIEDQGELKKPTEPSATSSSVSHNNGKTCHRKLKSGRVQEITIT